MQFAPLPADMIRRFEPTATRQDLVLAKQKWRVMDQIALQWRAKTQDPTSSRLATKTGRAISALFAGPSGTGKTMAAEVLANETRLAFYSIDLNRVVSKYLGEIEKKLEALFDATREAGALLFFDEADTLFGKRSEVADAHDRYANLGANPLLQRLEDYRGIVILATKDKQNFDPTFLRRLCYVVDFAFPDMAQRADIWRRIFPPDTPVEGLDPERLARLPLSGANIRDIARLSASLAASEWQPVRMAHLLRAALSECAKIGRPIDVAAIERP
jgi:SpoVK/Ycf46/Vps4 family AAA+-type ATPase